jgi:hypothetical protein
MSSCWCGCSYAISCQASTHNPLAYINVVTIPRQCHYLLVMCALPCISLSETRQPHEHLPFAGGLYSGFTPNLIRNSIISASELVAYDVSKRKYGQLGVPDGPGLHMLSGLTAGLIATILGNPMDVVSTRIMVHKATGGNDNMVEACRTMLLKEGIFSFYQGFVPNFCRIGSFNVVLWMSLEHLRTLFG